MSSHSLKRNRQLLSGSDLLHQSPQQTIFDTEPAVAVAAESTQTQETIRHQLRTGHQVQIDMDGQEIEVEDPQGNVAVKIRLEAQGPVVELDGARLQLRSTKEVNVACEDFSVNADKNVYLNAGGHITLESTEELHINCEVDLRLRAKVIWLN